MLTKSIKHCICHRCNDPIIGYKFNHGHGKFFCWNCGNSKNLNDRTSTPYATKLCLLFSSATGKNRKKIIDHNDMVHAMRLEF